METANKLVGADYVASKLDVSKPTACRIIRSLNSELIEAGARVIPGRVNLEYLEATYFAQPQKREVGHDDRAEI